MEKEMEKPTCPNCRAPLVQVGEPEHVVDQFESSLIYLYRCPRCRRKFEYVSTWRELTE
ncbi:hypothetical protein HRbin24_00084 [bacterium HR24]|nr:hypothetical protein HRbin24_00084 [bacterium HR24]